MLDSSKDIRYLLQLPEFEDRLTTYAQICGEYLRGTTVMTYGTIDTSGLDASELEPLEKDGFFLSKRKVRSLFQDGETVELIKRIELRIGLFQPSAS